MTAIVPLAEQANMIGERAIHHILYVAEPAATQVSRVCTTRILFISLCALKYFLNR